MVMPEPREDGRDVAVLDCADELTLGEIVHEEATFKKCIVDSCGERLISRTPAIEGRAINVEFLARDLENGRFSKLFKECHLRFRVLFHRRIAFFPLSFSYRFRMSVANTGSISHRKARRCNCSAATMRLPEPAVRSSKLSPIFVQRRRAFSWRVGLFCVGCRYLLPGNRFTSHTLKSSMISSIA